MKYPLGIQDFATLREGGYVYVDKTEYLYDCLDTSRYNFLSRPRRFGKSLLLSTINELYSGRAELFEGLWIERHWDFAARERPVIWIQFSRMDYQGLGLANAIHRELERVARSFAIELEGLSFKSDFEILLRRLGTTVNRVVLLIDEYDKPLIDYIDTPEKAVSNQQVLKSFYSVLKDSDPYLEQLFITGVSAFSQVSIFSDLNNVRNLTLDRRAYLLTGISQTELERIFAEQLAEEDADKVRRWYNGYSWGSEERLYNPFSLLNFLSSRQYRNYWFASGTPSFLFKEMQRRELYNPVGLLADDLTLLSFDLRRLHPTGILFQTGYLTVDTYREEDYAYRLTYPNLEVRASLEKLLLQYYLRQDKEDAFVRVIGIRDALYADDVDTVVRILNAAFAGIPYEHWKGQQEHLFHAAVHLVFSLLGVYVQSEVHTAKGRCDARVLLPTLVYAFEFKLQQSAEAALRQIEERGYLTPYADDPRPKRAVGIRFSTEARAITEWLVGKTH